MRKLLLVALVSVFAFGFTGCNKDEDLPTPQETTPIVVVTNPAVQNFKYVKGSGFTNLYLVVTTTSSTPIFNDQIYNNPSLSQFQITEDETYLYTITDGNIYSESGAFGYTSTGGIWNTPSTSPADVQLNHTGNTITIYR